MPSNVTKLRGTHRPARTRNEPKPRPIAPAPPDHLDKLGKAKWRTLSPKLETLGLLTEIDGDAFAVYCELYSRWRTAKAVLRKRGLTATHKGYTQQRAEVSIVRQCEGLMLRYLQEFGLTPSARSRVHAAPDEDEDDFEEFVSRGKKKP